MTLLQLLTITQKYFREKGIESARLDAELLLGHCLGLDRVGLYLQHDRPLHEREIRAYREVVRRRAAYEPVAYITGTRSFWTLALRIDRGVLIPRPETEVLVEHALAFLSTLGKARPRVLDIGTGSGAIALALAAEMPQLDIVALDASAQAASCARVNVEHLGLSAQVQVKKAIFPDDCVQHGRCYDLIVSNPPYIPSGEIEHLASDIREYEPRAALDGGPDGLGMYRQWIPHCARLLVSGGALMFEIGHDQGPAVSALLGASGHFSAIDVVRDLARLERLAICRRV